MEHPASSGGRSAGDGGNDAVGVRQDPSGAPSRQSKVSPSAPGAPSPQADPCEIREGKRPGPKPAKTSGLDPGVQKAGIIEFEAARKRRETQRQHEEAQRRKEKAAAERELDRRRGALEKAQTMRDRARERHEAKLAALEKERDAVDTRIAAEQEHWEREEKDLDRAIARAKD